MSYASEVLRLSGVEGNPSCYRQRRDFLLTKVLAAFPPEVVAALFHRQVIPPVVPSADSPPYLMLSLRDRT